MPRGKPKRVIQVEVPEDEAEEPEQTASEAEAEETMREVDTEAPDRIDARIFRSHPATGNREALTDVIDAKLFSQDYVRETYGGGRYRIDFIGPQRGKAGKPGRGKVGQKRFDIDVTLPPRHPRTTLGEGATVMPAASGNDRVSMLMEGGIIQLFKAMEATTQMQLRAMEARATVVTPIDWAAVATIATPVVTALITLLGSRKDPVEIARQIAETVGERPRERTTIDELRSLVSLVKEISPASGSDAKDGSTWLDVVRDIAPGVLAAVNNNRQPAPTASSGLMLPSQVSPPSPTRSDTSNGSATPSPVAPAPNLPPSMMLFRSLIPVVFDAARKGKDPELTADWLLSDVPEGHYDSLHATLAQPGFLTELIGAVPALAPFDGWVTKLHSALLRLTGDGDGDEDDGEGETPG